MAGKLGLFEDFQNGVSGKSKSANKLVDDMQKKIDTLKSQLVDIENKINQLDAE